MGDLIPFNPSRRCKNKIPPGEPEQILSERHQEILADRIDMMIKTVNARDLDEIRRQTPDKITDLHSSQNFIVKLARRAGLLYQMLFDDDLPKSRELTRTIAAGLLYFVNPGDFLPDNAPGIGYLDDAYVIYRVWEMICPEVQSYIAARGLNPQDYQ